MKRWVFRTPEGPPASMGSLATCVLVSNLACALAPVALRGQAEPMQAEVQDSAARALYLRAVAQRFTISPDEVAILAAWDLGTDEVPVVLRLARLSGVSPDVVVALRNDGRPWSAVADRIGVTVRRLLVPSGSDAIRSRRGDPAEASGETRVTGLPSELSDQDLVDLVNLQLVMRSLGLSPERVLGVRSAAGDWVRAYGILAGR